MIQDTLREHLKFLLDSINRQSAGHRQDAALDRRRAATSEAMADTLDGQAREIEATLESGNLPRVATT